MAPARESYVGIARRWRPQTFSEIVGQKSAVDQIRLDVSTNRIKHAYLFTGPRGVGKTSMARVLAKALNCDQGPTTEPCGKCVRCVSITHGSDVDTIEIDAATYTKVENIRDLQEGFNRAPFGGRYKVYIIDEVHMLSDSAFNALLKSLEEPPSKVVFVLATTNPEKIPETVRSRCAQIEFRRIATEDIAEQLLKILESEPSVKLAEGERDAILDAIAVTSEGGLRDAEVTLDQLISLGEEEITLERVQQLLGVVESDLLRKCVAALFDRDTLALLEIAHNLVEHGRDLQRFVKTLLHYLRDLLLLRVISARASDDSADRLGVSHSRAGFAEMRALAERVSTPFLLNAIQQFLTLDERLRGVAPQRFLLEFTFVKMAEMDRSMDVAGALETLTSIRRPPQQRRANPPQGQAPPRPAPPARPAGNPQPPRRTQRQQPAPDMGWQGGANQQPQPNSQGWGGAAPASASGNPVAPQGFQGGSHTSQPSATSVSSQPYAGPSSAAAATMVHEESAAYQPQPQPQSQAQPETQTQPRRNIKPIGLDDPDRFWQAFLGEALRSQDMITMKPCLEGAYLIEVNGTKINVGVPDKGQTPGFKHKRLNKPDKRQALSEMASALAGRNVKLVFEHVQEEKAPVSSSASSEVSSYAPPMEEQAPPPFSMEGFEIPPVSKGEIPMHEFEEALQKYPDLKEAVDLVRKSFKIKPEAFNDKKIR